MNEISKNGKLEEFEELDDMQEMLEFLSNASENNESEELMKKQELEFTLEEEICSLSMQTFLKMFAKFKTLSEEDQTAIEAATDDFNDTDNDGMTRHGALVTALQIFFPQPGSQKNITRKNDGVYQTPCEDCNGNPTHLIQFIQQNRIEEHFLCESCEANAMKEE